VSFEYRVRLVKTLRNDKQTSARTLTHLLDLLGGLLGSSLLDLLFSSLLDLLGGSLLDSGGGLLLGGLKEKGRATYIISYNE
jgi:hypothetical protein